MDERQKSLPPNTAMSAVSVWLRLFPRAHRRIAGGEMWESNVSAEAPAGYVEEMWDDALKVRFRFGLARRAEYEKVGPHRERRKDARGEK